MASRALTYAELRALGVAYSRAHLLKLEREGLFPRHFKLSERKVCWDQDAVVAWIRAKRAQGPAKGLTKPHVLPRVLPDRDDVDDDEFSYADLLSLGISYSRDAIARLERKDKFPTHHFTDSSPHARWNADEVMAWLDSKRAGVGWAPCDPRDAVTGRCLPPELPVVVPTVMRRPLPTVEAKPVVVSLARRVVSS